MVRAYLLTITTVLVLTSCGRVGTSPQAEEGILDLRDWDFISDGNLNLNGEWVFDWESFVDPQTTLTSGQHQIVDVPGYWNGNIIEDRSLDGYGFATYRLRVLLPPDTPELAIRTRDIQTAFVLYVNGEPLNSAGLVGTSAERSRANYAPIMKRYVPDSETLDIVIHVSNFHHRNGGIWVPIRLGESETMRRVQDNINIADFFIIGIIASMAIYHILRWIIDRSDRMSLHFGLFCVFVAVRATIVGELHAYRILPVFDWRVYHRLEYLAFAGALPAFLYYIRALFRDRVHRLALWIVLACGITFSLLITLTPASVYSRALLPFQVVTLATGIYVFVVLFAALREKRSAAGFLLIGFVVLFAFVVNDILYANDLIRTGHIMDWGMLLFLLSQAYLITSISTEDAKMVDRQNRDLTETRLGVIVGLAKLAEYRDEDTGIHLTRIQEYCRILAVTLATKPDYRGYIGDEYIEDLYQSAILHDIGKVGVSDSILLKPGRLTSEEFEEIKKHTVIGGDAISDVEKGLTNRTFLSLGKEIAYYHHEKWDGSGYPYGRKGPDIPLSARIVALADVYDALTSRRPYKGAFPHEQAREIIVDGRETHFDPILVDTFLEVEGEFRKLMEKMKD